MVIVPKSTYRYRGLFIDIGYPLSEDQNKGLDAIKEQMNVAFDGYTVDQANTINSETGLTKWQQFMIANASAFLSEIQLRAYKTYYAMENTYSSGSENIDGPPFAYRRGD